MQDSQKIHAFLAHQGVASRRAAEKMVEEGRIKVNGEMAHIAQRVNSSDKIEVDNVPLNNNHTAHVYLMLHKPQGVVSTTHDEMGRKTVLDFLPEESPTLYPVGRLDMDSEGLILLTNDGDLTYTITHPKFEIVKTYQVLISGIPSTPALQHLRRGIRLKERFVKPVKVEILKRESGNTWLSISIKEGLNHQVRRMIERTGYDVLRLVRTAIGTLELGKLPVGTIKTLTKEILWDSLGIVNVRDKVK